MGTTRKVLLTRLFRLCVMWAKNIKHNEIDHQFPNCFHQVHGRLEQVVQARHEH